MPLIDVDLPILAENRSEFAGVGASVLLSSADVIRTCRDKRATSRFFKNHGIPTVPTISLRQIEEKPVPYPVFIKPSIGSGSIRSYKVCNSSELSFFLKHVPDPIVQKFAWGEEYTIDTLSDLEGKVLNVVPRKEN